MPIGCRSKTELSMIDVFNRGEHPMIVFDKHITRTIERNHAIKAEVTFCVRGVISPLLSNLVLDELDKELTRRGLRFCRYADDCNIYVRSRRAGERIKASVSRFLTNKLRLTVNEAKSAVARPEE